MGITLWARTRHHVETSIASAAPNDDGSLSLFPPSSYSQSKVFGHYCGRIHNAYLKSKLRIGEIRRVSARLAQNILVWWNFDWTAGGGSIPLRLNAFQARIRSTAALPS
jgi:hypothetical protein